MMHISEGVFWVTVLLVAGLATAMFLTGVQWGQHTRAGDYDEGHADGLLDGEGMAHRAWEALGLGTYDEVAALGMTGGYGAFAAAPVADTISLGPPPAKVLLAEADRQLADQQLAANDAAWTPEQHALALADYHPGPADLPWLPGRSAVTFDYTPDVSDTITGVVVQAAEPEHTTEWLAAQSRKMEADTALFIAQMEHHCAEFQATLTGE